MTDAAELWSTCFTPDSLAALVGNGLLGGLGSPQRPVAAVWTSYGVVGGGLGFLERVWAPFPWLEL